MLKVHRRVLVSFLLFLSTSLIINELKALPLDDTHRNGHLEDYESFVYSAVHNLVSSSHPSIRAAVNYLEIGQHIEAPELTNPARMPECLSSRRVSKALEAAINEKYAGQLMNNASVDTTYIQQLRQCYYSSFIAIPGPEEITQQLLEAAKHNTLCDLLPKYCAGLNLVPAPAPSAETAPDSTSTGSSWKPNNPSGPGASKPIDSQQQQHGIQRRGQSSIASTTPYLLQSSDGTGNPELPPVLDFKCVKHTYNQVLDHFARSDEHPVDRAAASRRLQEKAPVGTLPGKSGDDDSKSQQHKRQTTFEQVYWVCDAAWPKDHHEQKHSGNVIVFLGNESPLGVPKQPIVFENARRLNALVVLVEHRYYGESLPYPEPEDDRVPTDQYRWLSIEQVIEDTASVVQHVRKEREVPDAVPNIVIGGSYGGMIASYHRVVRPDVFDSAVAASAPIYYIVDTKMWHDTSNRYHQFIEDAANTMSGSTHCSDTVRQGLERILQLGESASGRDEIVTTMNLCGNGTTALPDEEAVLGLQNDVIGSFQGLAQVNNQPPVLGEMAIACEVINNATAAGRSPLEAISALYTYMGSNGSSSWCYNFTYQPKFPVLPDVASGYNSYTYQCCTEATVYSSELPAKASDSTLNPKKIPVSVSEIQDNCRNIFGKHVPELEGPNFARKIMPLLKEYGGVVFTNGDLDGWAGGSLGLLPITELNMTIQSEKDIPDAPAPTKQDDFGKDGGLDEHSRVAFVVYRNASHCTDTHTNTWRTPDEPLEWAKQRALAMDYAAAFARLNKQRHVERDVDIVQR